MDKGNLAGHQMAGELVEVVGAPALTPVWVVLAAAVETYREYGKGGRRYFSSPEAADTRDFKGMLAKGIITVILGTGAAFGAEKENCSLEFGIFGRISGIAIRKVCAAPDEMRLSVVRYHAGSDRKY